ncbi:NAD-dependent epimerase/dehydratase family protein [Sphaerisporangium perillae]|uniref:NAD-dependent epimerase/dehydratase family protein n=1 Tax=Sphaerisporangium perillae TaxID=2935860 RepID=UPI00200D014B|nr:NAD(P)-dependent oxidoreductase [Sphaerisporangium perillae]
MRLTLVAVVSVRPSPGRAATFRPAVAVTGPALHAALGGRPGAARGRAGCGDLGHEVVVTTHRRTEVPSFLAGRVTVEPLDVTDRDAFLALAGRHDISDIVHLAGSIPGEDPVDFFRTDTTGLLNALDAARTWGVRRFAVASSLGVYIGRTETRWHEELALPTADLPHLIIAFKKAVEPLTTHSLQGTGVQPVVLRIGSI